MEGNDSSKERERYSNFLKRRGVRILFFFWEGSKRFSLGLGEKEGKWNKGKMIFLSVDWISRD